MTMIDQWDMDRRRRLAHAIRNYIDHGTIPDVGHFRGVVENIHHRASPSTDWGRRYAVHERAVAYAKHLPAIGHYHHAADQWFVVMSIILRLECYLGEE